MLGFFKVGSGRAGDDEPLQSACKLMAFSLLGNLASAEFSEFNESDKISMN